MFKIIKYDIKGSYKSYLIIYSISIILSLLIFSKVNSWEEMIIPLISVVNLGLFIVSLVFVITSFKNELYENRAYLTFTLPISSNKIIVGKILTSLIWFVFAGILANILQYISFNLIFDKEQLNVITQLIQSISFKSVFLIIISILFMVLFLIITIYSAITISKVTFKNKKIGGFAGFVFFIIINILTGFAKSKISNALPLYIKINEKFNVNINNPNFGMTSFYTPPNIVYEINATSVIIYVLAFLGLFMLTSYLLEKKVDL